MGERNGFPAETMQLLLFLFGQLEYVGNFVEENLGRVRSPQVTADHTGGHPQAFCKITCAERTAFQQFQKNAAKSTRTTACSWYVPYDCILHIFYQM